MMLQIYVLFFFTFKIGMPVLPSKRNRFAELSFFIVFIVHVMT